MQGTVILHNRHSARTVNRVPPVLLVVYNLQTFHGKPGHDHSLTFPLARRTPCTTTAPCAAVGH